MQSLCLNIVSVLIPFISGHGFEYQLATEMPGYKVLIPFISGHGFEFRVP